MMTHLVVMILWTKFNQPLLLQGKLLKINLLRRIKRMTKTISEGPEDKWPQIQKVKSNSRPAEFKVAASLTKVMIARYKIRRPINKARKLLTSRRKIRSFNQITKTMSSKKRSKYLHKIIQIILKITKIRTRALTIRSHHRMTTKINLRKISGMRKRSWSGSWPSNKSLPGERCSKRCKAKDRWLLMIKLNSWSSNLVSLSRLVLPTTGIRNCRKRRGFVKRNCRISGKESLKKLRPKGNQVNHKRTLWSQRRRSLTLLRSRFRKKRLNRVKRLSQRRSLSTSQKKDRLLSILTHMILLSKITSLPNLPRGGSTHSQLTLRMTMITNLLLLRKNWPLFLILISKSLRTWIR